MMFFAFTREGAKFEDPFMTAFEHELSLRRPLWWQKDGIMFIPYATCKTSLESVQNIVFQSCFRKGSSLQPPCTKMSQIDTGLSIRMCMTDFPMSAFKYAT